MKSNIWPADKTERRPVAELIPYARNARTHSDEQVAQIAASIKEWGWTTPVLIDEDGGIIAGHGRVMAARKLGLVDVPCMVAKGWSEAQKRAYVLADNQLAVNAGWNADLLSTELKGLGELGFDLGLLGFPDLDALMAEKTQGLTDPDEVPEAPANPVTVLGDVWVMGRHRLMCGDSTSVDAVHRLMAGQRADMVFTDPPYGMFLDADYSGMKSKFKGSSGGKKYENVKGDHADFDPDFINTIFAVFDYCNEVFLWGADYYADLLPNRNAGSWVVWDKRGDESADKMFGSTFELCWSKTRHKRMLARVKWAGIFGMEKEHDKKRCHPTQKPVELVTWFFDYYSMQDKKVVVDLFGGSGSTLIACEQTGRDARLMELDPRYCDVIVKRWQDFTGQQATLEGDGRAFNEIAAERLQEAA
jgi:DNA modification methylase